MTRLHANPDNRWRHSDTLLLGAIGLLAGILSYRVLRFLKETDDHLFMLEHDVHGLTLALNVDVNSIARDIAAIREKSAACLCGSRPRRLSSRKRSDLTDNRPGETR